MEIIYSSLLQSTLKYCTCIYWETSTSLKVLDVLWGSGYRVAISRSVIKVVEFSCWTNFSKISSVAPLQRRTINSLFHACLATKTVANWEKIPPPTDCYTTSSVLFFFCDVQQHRKCCITAPSAPVWSNHNNTLINKGPRLMHIPQHFMTHGSYFKDFSNVGSYRKFKCL